MPEYSYSPNEGWKENETPAPFTDEDRDALDAHLLRRFPVFTPRDIAFFGGWVEELRELTESGASP